MSLEVSAVPLTCERPGGFLESCRASVYFRRLTKPVLIAREGCRSRINELVSESEDKQVKSKASPLPVLSSELPPAGATHIWAGSSRFTQRD